MKKKKKNTSKWPMIFAVLFFTAILAGTLYYFHVKNEEKVLHGNVFDATTNTITIVTKENDLFTFSKEDVVVDGETSGLKIGNPLTLHYKGFLDPTSIAQKATLTAVIVKDLPKETPAPSKEPDVKPEEEPEVEPISAEKLLNEMTLEEKVGQMFFVRCPKENQIEDINRYHMGGYILFGRDFKEKEFQEVQKTIHAYQEESDIPLFIGVDEEGGIVNRVSTNPNFRETPFQSPQELYNEGGFQRIIEDTYEKIELLKEIGINVNFAPVADVSKAEEDYIYPRAFGQDAEATANYVSLMTRILRDNEMGSVLKHFPGYGNNVDTHSQIGRDDRELDTFLKNDLKPFEAGIEKGASFILVAHNIVSAFDENYPASLSKEVHNFLRQDLGYEGIIITDDLYMEGVKELYGDEESVVLAIEAGNDMLCSTDYRIQIPAVIKAIEEGRIKEERIDASVLRILNEKIALGLIS